MRAKHARSRARRRVAQGRWSYDDLMRFPDRQLLRNRKLRKSVRETKDRSHPFMVLQHKYPWPSTFKVDFLTHLDVLRRRQANLKKMHAAYRNRS